MPIKVKAYHQLPGNPNSSGLQSEVAHWPAAVVGGTAQLVAAHCPNECTLDPQYSSSRASRTMAFTPQCFPAAMTHFFSSEYYEVLIAHKNWKKMADRSIDRSQCLSNRATQLLYTVGQKKHKCRLLSISSLNIDRFSKCLQNVTAAFSCYVTGALLQGIERATKWRVKTKLKTKVMVLNWILGQS